ncbi:plasmid partitioning protein RepA [Terrarubrum flagellatum]|uniref:plasmid partitioning protein RepA n=1 Tax=Terrirubrum flagellatum TaxID=2895980 RepID=UPI003145040F
MPSADETIGEHAEALSAQLQSISAALFPPTATKELRKFSSGEVARLIGVNDSRIRQLSLAGEGPQPELTPTGRRQYTLGQINELRAHLGAAAKNRREAREYLPHRQPGEELQVLAVTNFKGGSGKTTTSAHLAQYLALRGYRVLVIDLDPQASLSALHGLMPELQVGENDTLYGAIRYDGDRRPLAEIIRSTYFAGLDLVPGNLELMEFEHETPRALAAGMRSADQLFFARVAKALDTVAERYDVVVIDCPPHLGYLTLSGLCAATGMIVTVHPQMLDVASMSQFLLMTKDLLRVVREAGGRLQYDFIRYLLTRYEPQDGPQTKIVALLRNLFGDAVLTNPMVKSTAMSDAGLTKQTLYEIGRESMTRSTYDRAHDALEAVHTEIENLIRTAWGREPRMRSQP